MSLPLSPNATIGILGGGQLGRMMALEAARLGFRTLVFAPEDSPPAALVAAGHIRADYRSQPDLDRFIAGTDAVTLEFENIPAATIAYIATKRPVAPGPKVLATAQHRGREKRLAAALGIETTPWRQVRRFADLTAAVEEIGVPAILKTASLGYDGKGQTAISSTDPKDLKAAWTALGTEDAVLEAKIDLHREVSVLIARDWQSNMALYDVAENRHENHILSETRVPADIDPALAELANDAAREIAEAVDLTGVLALEFFIDGKGRLIFNEMAPRPHNSGHWTQDGAMTSQFEQAVRAAAGLPLGPTTRLRPVRMQNLLGDPAEVWRAALRNPAARVHLYAKAEPIPGRKMGHINWLS